MSSKLYVGNLSFNVTESELTSAFSPYGEVIRASVVTDRDSGRSRGFGFVEMATEDEANAAVDGLNGTQMGGRDLTVNIARPREDRGGSGGGGGGGSRGGFGGGGGGGRDGGGSRGGRW